MNCELEWTADRTINYIVSTLDLPRGKEFPELGMSWTFSYKLVYGEQSVPSQDTQGGRNLGREYCQNQHWREVQRPL
jgi:hypothetical protein